MTPYECIEIAKALFSKMSRYDPYRIVTVNGKKRCLADVLRKRALRNSLISSTADRIASGCDNEIMDELKAYKVCSA